MRGLGILTLSLVLASGTAHAGLNFDFSFTNNIGSVTGTVTGEIFGLTDNSTSAATDVVVNNYPTGVLVLPGTPWDVFNDGSLSISQNSFTVAAGVVTAAEFEDSNPPVVFGLNIGGTESALQDAFGKNVVNNGGFAGITFTPDSGSVPEPGSIALLLSGLFGLRLIRRRG